MTSNSTEEYYNGFYKELSKLDELSNTFKKIESFLPELKGKDQKKHPYLYWEFLEKGGRQAVRMNKWKAVRMNMSKDPDSPIELYNIDEDLGEQENLAVQYPEVLKEMNRIMNKEHMASTIFQFEFEKNMAND